MKTASPKKRPKADVAKELSTQDKINAANAKAHDAEVAALQDTIKADLERDLEKVIPSTARLEAFGQRSFGPPACGWPVFK